MGVSIYYYAYRNQPLTQTELENITDIIEEFNEKIAVLDIDCEEFGFYESIDTDCILFGSIKPTTDETKVIKNIMDILSTITKLRKTIPTAKWNVCLDDLEAQWDDDIGYSLS